RRRGGYCRIGRGGCRGRGGAARAQGQGSRALRAVRLGAGRFGAPGHVPRGGSLSRVALVHDWLTGLRGGERGLQAICELYPEADIFTLVHVPGSCGPIIESRRITTSFLQQLPGAERRYRHFLPLFPLAIESLD